MGTVKLKRAVIREELVKLTGNYKYAILLNQLLYWSERINQEKYKLFIKEELTRKEDDIKDLEGGWIYKKSEELAEELMIGTSAATIRRWVIKLMEQGYILRRKNPIKKWDNTYQYRLNLIKIQKDLLKLGYTLEGYKNIIAMREEQSQSPTPPNFQNENRRFHNENTHFQNEKTLPEITTETTTKNKEPINHSPAEQDKPSIPYTEIIEHLNNRIGSHYQSTTKKTQKLISARWNEGFRLEDFFTVIDKKCVEWVGDKKMEKYLRPPTLFGPNFESYLNQLSVENEGKSKGQKKNDMLKELYQQAIEDDENGKGIDIF